MLEIPELNIEALLRGLLLCLISITSVGCGSGGGGDGGGGGGSGLSDGSQRSARTGIRIIHASLDSEPVDLNIGGVYVNRGAFMLPNFYQPVPEGLQNILLERANSPGVTVFTQPTTLAKDTEYTLLVSGRVTARTFLVTVLEEPVVRPEVGQGRVQLINLLEGSSPLTLTGGGVTLGPVAFRLASGYAVLPSGAQTFTVTNAQGGVLGVFPTTIADRGEITIVYGGAAQEGVVLNRIYTDLD